MEITQHFATTGAMQSEEVKTGSMELLDAELNALEEVIKLLETRISPVLSQYASDKLSSPEPEPPSAIAGRVRRLYCARGALQEIISRVDL